MDMNYYKLMKSGVHVKSKTMSINLPLTIKIHKNWSAKALASIVILRIPCLIINDKSVLVRDGVLSV